MSTAAAVRGRRDDAGWPERRSTWRCAGTTVATEVRRSQSHVHIMLAIILNAVILTTGTGTPSRSCRFGFLGTPRSTVPGAVLPERWITGPDLDARGRPEPRGVRAAPLLSAILGRS